MVRSGREQITQSPAVKGKEKARFLFKKGKTPTKSSRFRSGGRGGLRRTQMDSGEEERLYILR